MVVHRTFDGTYRDNVVSWEELRELISSDNLGELARSKQVLEDYQKRSVEIKKEYYSIKDYIQIRFLKYPYSEVDVEEPNDPTFPATSPKIIIKKKQAITTSPPPSQIALYPNDFPYFFPSNIDHLVLWCDKPLSKEEVDKEIKILLKERYGDAPIETQQLLIMLFCKV